MLYAYVHLYTETKIEQDPLLLNITNSWSPLLRIRRTSQTRGPNFRETSALSHLVSISLPIHSVILGFGDVQTPATALASVPSVGIPARRETSMNLDRGSGGAADSN